MTPEMHRVMTYIRSRIEDTGVAPTYAEIGAAMGYGSKSSTHRLVVALEERGLVERIPGRHRAIYLPGARPEAALADKVRDALRDYRERRATMRQTIVRIEMLVEVVA